MNTELKEPVYIPTEKPYDKFSTRIKTQKNKNNKNMEIKETITGTFHPDQLSRDIKENCSPGGSQVKTLKGAEELIRAKLKDLAGVRARSNSIVDNLKNEGTHSEIIPKPENQIVKSTIVDQFYNIAEIIDYIGRDIDDDLKSISDMIG